MSGTSRRAVRCGAAAAAAALMLAGCGGEGSGSDAVAPPASVSTTTGTTDSGAAAPSQVTAADPQKPATGAEAAESGSGTSKESAEVVDKAPAGLKQLATLPDLDVVRVASGDTTNLRSLAVSGKPTLLWFWAPHCPFCKAEAPKVLEFAKQYGDQVQIIGLGAQDDLAEAESFLAETGTTGLEMVWDSSGKSWVHYKVTNQPTVIVLNPDGKVARTWFREFDSDGIRAAAEIA
ncbi:TlpA disulfide reductase family protein [Sporichthya sp.]|uniref:TlpA family protein disulfide reductase n=1 Tax=Sporichthya sp. TaxID=65475 RepID=UPI0017913FC4|nr:TlpA disulfide reductase family protein [Sporichthya sp.]MBA3743341.1 TlpA family protein disulfide reductase [Sporichthya sp.]